MVQEEKPFKDIYYLELWRPFCFMQSRIICAIYGRRHYEEQICEIILNLDQWFKRRCRLKIFLIWSSGGPFVQQRNRLGNFGRGIMRNNSVNLI